MRFQSSLADAMPPASDSQALRIRGTFGDEGLRIARPPEPVISF